MPVDPAVSALKEYLERFPDTFKVNEPETEQDGQKAGEMRLARWRHQNRELARLSAEARQTQTPPAEPHLIDVNSPLHKTLQEMPVDKMKELIRLRTRRGSEQAAPSNLQPIGPGKQPMEAAQSVDDLMRQSGRMVRGHRRYPVGGQMGSGLLDEVPADFQPPQDRQGTPTWLKREAPVESSRPSWKRWLQNLIARLKGC